MLEESQNWATSLTNFFHLVCGPWGDNNFENVRRIGPLHLQIFHLLCGPQCGNNFEHVTRIGPLHLQNPATQCVGGPWGGKNCHHASLVITHNSIYKCFLFQHVTISLFLVKHISVGQLTLFMALNSKLIRLGHLLGYCPKKT